MAPESTGPAPRTRLLGGLRSRLAAGRRPAHSTGCEHLDSPAEPAPARSAICSECLRDGLAPVHLRLCEDCGNVGCCDSSAGRHATAHYETTGHPVMRSHEPGESWRWCYPHGLLG